ncbi:hypothetical protein AYO20_09097 [Fonsecaea nubica]|uniref:Uncharacterized protein n=1 Tax=Fonsecaea nubica TaxID=856822 RepID=A0A178CKX3_9EURO|nr:hypothetical protein AYO20_09097 [Fonsecaea nubica]OAL29713.1 hypothetical protein AYO20_09097 [Fonsecaea nubica]
MPQMTVARATLGSSHILERLLDPLLVRRIVSNPVNLRAFDNWKRDLDEALAEATPVAPPHPILRPRHESDSLYFRPDDDAQYVETYDVDLSELKDFIALYPSPDNVVPVLEDRKYRGTQSVASLRTVSPDRKAFVLLDEHVSSRLFIFLPSALIILFSSSLAVCRYP